MENPQTSVYSTHFLHAIISVFLYVPTTIWKKTCSAYIVCFILQNMIDSNAGKPLINECKKTRLNCKYACASVYFNNGKKFVKTCS